MLQRFKRWRLPLIAILLLISLWFWFDGTARVQRWIWNSRNQPVNTNFALDAHVPSLNMKMLGDRPYNPDWFTQGLTIHNSRLWIGTGRKGRSSVIEAGLYSDSVYQRVDLSSQYFGEGIDIVRDSLLYQLTYKSGEAFVYAIENLKRVRRFSYDTEGWGLIYLPGKDRLLQSDGSSTLYYRNPDSFEIEQKVTVRDAIGELAKINEMEWAYGAVWANVWGAEVIVRIDPETGKVTGKVDMSPVLRSVRRNAVTGVLNGIAYDPDQDVFWVTGKNWPRRYAVRIESDQ